MQSPEQRRAVAALGILPDVFDAACEEIAAGVGTPKVFKKLHIDPRGFWGLIAQNGNAATKYAQARARGLDKMANDIEQISDDMSIDADHKRIMVDTRKWLLSKLAPKKYGDLLHLEHSGTIDYASELESARRRGRGEVISGEISGVPTVE